ncbi:hypothetical protein N751_10325 [Legionella pneumophila str. Leg01/11]|nr:hypothetical protein N751_10325 [Legionella pneumophila str. Leg01/11]
MVGFLDEGLLNFLVKCPGHEVSFSGWIFR